MKTWVGVTIGVVSAAIIGTMIYIGFKSPDKDKEKETNPENNNTSNNSQSGGEKPKEKPKDLDVLPLNISKSKTSLSLVKQLQNGLNTYIANGTIVSAKLDEDGNFGKGTQNALFLLTGKKEVADSELFYSIINRTFQTRSAYAPYISA